MFNPNYNAQLYQVKRRRFVRETEDSVRVMLIPCMSPGVKRGVTLSQMLLSLRGFTFSVNVYLFQYCYWMIILQIYFLFNIAIFFSLLCFQLSRVFKLSCTEICVFIIALNSEDCADDDDGGGWETVQRSRSRVRHSPSLKTTDCVVDTVYTVSKKFSDSSFIRDTVCTVSNECSYSSSIMDTVCTVSNECSDSSFIVDTVCTVSNECSGSSFIRDTVCTVSKKCSDSSFIRDTVCTVSNECSGSSSIAFSDSARSGLPLSHIQIYYDDDCHSVSTDTSANPDCVGVSQQCQHSGVLCHQVDSRPCHGNPSITVHLEANVFTDDADANSDSEPKGQSSEEYLLPNMATVEGITYRGSSCMGVRMVVFC